MRIPKKYIENLENGIITESMLCDVLYSFNKMAKNWRDKKREYKDSYAFNHPSWVNLAFKNEQMYYSYKTDILNTLTPSCIHQEIIEGEYETIIHYYLFYKVSKKSFHNPIQKEDLVKYPNLEIIRIEQLLTKGVSKNRLLSFKFANDVRKALLNGSAKIIFDNNQK